MCQQVFHLVGKNPATFEVNIFGVCRCERHCDELHGRLLRRPAALVVVAAPARSSDVVPYVLAAVRQRCNVVTRQVPRLEAHRTIEAEIGVTLEEGAVVQGWHVLISDKG